MLDIELLGYFEQSSRGSTMVPSWKGPYRAVDTSQGQGGGQLAAGEVRTVSLASQVPETMTETPAAAVVNVKVSGSPATGSLTLWNPALAKPTVPDMAWTPGQVASQTALVTLDGASSFNMSASAATHVAVDVEAFVSSMPVTDTLNRTDPVAESQQSAILAREPGLRVDSLELAGLWGNIYEESLSGSGQSETVNPQAEDARAAYEAALGEFRATHSAAVDEFEHVATPDEPMYGFTDEVLRSSSAESAMTQAGVDPALQDELISATAARLLEPTKAPVQPAGFFEDFFVWIYGHAKDFTHRFQRADNFCGPATASMILEQQGVTTGPEGQPLTQANLAASKYLNVSPGGGTRWASYRMETTLEAWQPWRAVKIGPFDVVFRNDWVTIPRPSANQIKDIVFHSITHDRTVAIEVYEKARDGVNRYYGHPVNLNIAHWAVGSGYFFGGSWVVIADPAASPHVSWGDGVLPYSWIGAPNLDAMTDMHGIVA